MKTLISIALFTLVACGCSSEPAGPTYAEAVATYQAEVTLLDSLQTQMDAAKAKHKSALAEIDEKFNPQFRKIRTLSDDIELNNRTAAGGETLMRLELQKQEMEKVRSALYDDAHRAFGNETGSLVGELAEQKQRVESAKSLRDSLSK